MTRSRITDSAEIQAYIERALVVGTGREKIAQALGWSCWRSLVRGCGRRGLVLSCDQPKAEAPPPVHDLQELLAHRKSAFARKKKHEDARRLIPVKMPISGPYGVLWMGDPHVDDDGTDIGLIEQHIGIAKKTEGLYLANVGDTTNNWVGRLARLYGEQSTSSEQAWMLAEWMFKLGAGKWALLLGGNHDCWSGSGDPLRWIAGSVNALYQPTEARLELSQLGTKATIRVNARHDFSGHSQWNPAHGIMKAAQMGVKDHIMVCGHKHTSGIAMLKCPDEDLVTVCLQLASYKRFDRYAKERGFRDQHIAPAALTVIDTTRQASGVVTIFHDVEEGADFLKFKRRKK